MANVGPMRIICPPNVSPLSPGHHFDQLSTEEQFYAHYSAQYGLKIISNASTDRAAWSGTRIILQQVSPESQAIFDYILELYWVCVTNCTGDWTKMASRYNVAMADVKSFLNYAAMFLCNIGNYFVSIFLFADGELANSYHTRREKEIRSLSLPSRLTSSARLPCAHRLRLNFLMNLKTLYWQSSLAALVRQAKLHKVLTTQTATVMHSYSIGLENTRIQKTRTGDDLTYTILQASVEISRKQLTDLPLLHRPVYICRGDYSSDLNYICQFLEMARLYSANLLQSKINSFHQLSFISGDLDMYKEGQRLWVKDKNPSIETNIGFVEPYRDPFGVRAEFEGIVGLVNKDETKTLANLVRHADKFVRRLPWVDNTGNGNGAFEKESFGSPDFTSLHSKCL